MVKKRMVYAIYIAESIPGIMRFQLPNQHRYFIEGRYGRRSEKKALELAREDGIKDPVLCGCQLEGLPPERRIYEDDIADDWKN